MSSKLPHLTLAALIAASPSLADVPRVAVDIAPVHALVARVMEGAGTPDLIVSPGSSPHEYSLRPSQAAALQAADLVITVSPDLTPWLQDALDSLAGDARVIELIETDGTTVLPFREGALFESHQHDDHEEHAHEDGEHHHDEDHDEHAHEDGEHHHDEDHDEHTHEDGEAHHDEHAHDEDEAHHDEHDHGHSHAHGDHDPHAWLSLDNASVWLVAIAAELSALDPDNADLYHANAARAQTELEGLRSEINDVLAPVRGHSFVVFHDAYQYFETDFAFPATGAIALSDATDPGPARIAEIRDRIRDEGIDCVLAEPQFNPGLVASVLEGTEAGTGILDPLGSDLTPGPEFYSQLLRNMAATLATCLEQ